MSAQLDTYSPSKVVQDTQSADTLKSVAKAASCPTAGQHLFEVPIAKTGCDRLAIEQKYNTQCSSKHLEDVIAVFANILCALLLVSQADKEGPVSAAQQNSD